MAAATLIRNERLKLAATFLNTVGTGSVVIGIVAPLVAVWDNPGAVGAANLATRTLAFAVTGLLLHLGGQYLLGGIRDDKG